MSVNRFAEIRERWEVPLGSSFDLSLAGEDIDFLLSEVEREGNNRIAAEGYIQVLNKEILRLSLKVDRLQKDIEYLRGQMPIYRRWREALEKIATYHDVPGTGPSFEAAIARQALLGGPT